MNNEIGRKITSLTLIAIMVAGGLTFAVPGVVPAAHAANPNLFVSAENSQFDNYMSGPQVIEVVVIDSDRNETDESQGEPKVTVNGKKLNMVQATDGNWYGYFADATQAQIADTIVADIGTPGQGLDFGQFCDNGVILDGTGTSSVDFGETVGVALPYAATNSLDGVIPTVAPLCGTLTDAAATNINNVVREAETPTPEAGSVNFGQIDINEAAWPFIQLYNLNPTGNVVVQYSPAGAVQTTTLTFDTAQDYASVELDRSVYGKGMEVHAIITDLWLNIDPTDEDSWTFGTNSGSSAAGSYYQVFDENGNGAGDAVPNGVIQLDSDDIDALMCDDNCVLFLDIFSSAGTRVLEIQDNDDSDIVDSVGNGLAEDFQTAGDLTAIPPVTPSLLGAVPVTVTEQGPNSGVFSTSDESDTSSIKIIGDGFVRGQAAEIDYNDSPVSILTGFIAGSVDIQPVDDEWSSGEEIPVVVDDHDLNLNSRADEDLDLFNPEIDHIPTLQTGDPITLAGFDNPRTSAIEGSATLDSITVFPRPNANTEQIERFSDRVFLEPGSDIPTLATGDELVLTLEDTTFEDLYDSVGENGVNDFRGVSLINYDIRSIFNNADVDSVEVRISDGTANEVVIATDVGPQELIELTNDDFFDFGDDSNVVLIFEFTMDSTSAIDANTVMPIVVDFFSFGFFDDGVAAADRVANQIIRLELEETADNSGLFEGSLEYTMINQLNILDSETYTNLSTIADDPTFIVIEDLTDEDSPRVNYLEIIDDGVPTNRADQEEAPSHSGIVSFDSDNYKVADTVYITLEDQDLNVDSDLLEIYTTVETADVAFGAVGEAGLPEFSFGPLGRLLDVTFDDIAWKTPSGTCDLTGTADTGLDAVTFSLVETDAESGVFKGSFEIPDKWCRADDGSSETTTGLDIEVNYVDFRDASGEIIEVGDSAGIRANTGSISLDRTVYPVPFGVPDNFSTSDETSPDGRSLFPIHQTGMDTAGSDRVADGLQDGEFLPEGDLIVHLRVNDPDFDTSGAGEDFIRQDRSDLPVGPVKISVIRGSETVILGFAGGAEESSGTINVGNDLVGDGRVANGELEITSSTAGFGGTTASGDPSLFTDTGALTIEQGTLTATAVFNDNAANGIDSGNEIDSLAGADLGSFVTGPITIEDDTTGEVVGALFSDTGAAGLGSGSEINSISSFTSGSVLICQGNMSTSDCATGTFANLGTGVIDEDEITVINKDDGMTPGNVIIGTEIEAGANFNDIAPPAGLDDPANELSAFINGAAFVNGEVTIVDSNSNASTADFTDGAADGLTAGSELSSLTGDEEDFVTGQISIFQSVNTAEAIWADLNSDTNIDDGELTITNGGSGFVSSDVLIIRQGALTATLDFNDALTTLENDELLVSPSPSGSGFVNGQVTITPNPSVSGVSATATFTDSPTVRDFGPIEEIAPDAGIFELDLTIKYTDGPADSLCPETANFEPLDGSNGSSELNRFNQASGSNENYCILQGDILQVEYEDPTDASGDRNTVTDSATFDLRNGVLQSDKSVYIIGSDIILTLIEPDLDLDNDTAETWDLDLIEWDSDAATITMGDAEDSPNNGVSAAFDPEPSNFRETGDSTGIFQIVIETPEVLEGDRLERGEEIILEYTDWGPSGSDYVGDEDEDVNLTLYTSNFGATVELDQKVYSWTDKSYITIVAPDHNFDSDLVDEIGNTDLDPIKVSTRGADLDNYKLVETGTDTGIFTGEVILTGFTHDADGDSTTGDDNGNDVVSRSPSGSGPTDGLLPADDDDGLTVSFEFSEDETVVGSALIRWNIGEVQWLEASYPASGTGVVRIIDPDMNLDPEAVDNFDVDVWSDSDAGGIDLTVTETNEATGIFEGTVFFTVTDESSGHRLRVAEGDTVTAEYEDNTLPDPYTTADELDITATSLIGTVVPPLERAPIVSCRVVDAFGNTLSSVSVDQQVQITCDLANGQDREQQFAYLVQIQDDNGVTVQLAWITGSLAPGQSFSPAQSWIPDAAGSYDATAFVWESVDNPTALSPPVTTPITVN